MESSNPTSDSLLPEGSGGTISSQVGNIFTVILVLAVIIALIVLLIRFLGKRNLTLSKNRSIRTLGAVGLGPNKSLQVLEIGGKIYVVGVGDDVTLVDKISDQTEAAYMIDSFEENSRGNDFQKLSSFVNTVAARFRKEQPPVEEEMDGTPFHEVFESKLKKIPNRRQQVQEILQEEESTDRLRDS